jgi:hypothetical protein
MVIFPNNKFIKEGPDSSLEAPNQQGKVIATKSARVVGNNQKNRRREQSDTEYDGDKPSIRPKPRHTKLGSVGNTRRERKKRNTERQEKGEHHYCLPPLESLSPSYSL